MSYEPVRIHLEHWAIHPSGVLIGQDAQKDFWVGRLRRGKGDNDVDRIEWSQAWETLKGEP